jgi:glycosyltransferase involved in cell wall biosynthesis
LRLAGFAVTVVSAPGDALNWITEEEGVTAYPLPMRRGIAPIADLIALLAVYRILAKLKPAITDFSTPKAGLLGNLAAWGLRVPHRIYTLRGLRLEAASGGKRQILLWSERLASWCAHRVLCNSRSLRSMARVLQVAPEQKLCLLGDGSSNGVDLVRFAPGPTSIRLELGLGNCDPVLGFVGRLTNDKGVPELLLAFQQILCRYPNCWLLLVGWFDEAEDRLDPTWRSYIASHPRIHYTGFVTETTPYYRAMDVFVLPTHREGFPNAALEAAACGLPVITTKSTGARDAVLSEVTGLQISPGLPRAIEEAVSELLENPVRRKRMGDAGRAWVTQHYSQERVLNLAVEFYRGLLQD